MQRGLVVISGVVLALLAIVPVHAEDDDKWDDRVTISGTVWIDENVDGIRQSSEPGAAGVRLDRLIGPYPHNASWTDERGQYTFEVWPWHRRSLSGYVPGQSVKLNAYYIRNGDYPVRETDWGLSYTHHGCAFVRVLPQGTERTVHIRMLRHYADDRNPRPPQNWSVADGRFFTEKGHGCDTGFPVTDADGIPFWDTWQGLGLEYVGYPISHRYIWRGSVTQAFQKTIMQWRPGRGVFFVNLFDELHDAGKDAELRKEWAIPFHLEFDPVQGWDWDEFVQRRLALLDANHAIKERYFAARDPLLRFGLPTSPVEDYGNMFVIRTQKAVFQQWKEDVPWAEAGEVTIANGGDITEALKKSLGWFPAEALSPQHVDLIDLP